MSIVAKRSSVSATAELLSKWRLSDIVDVAGMLGPAVKSIRNGLYRRANWFESIQ